MKNKTLSTKKVERFFFSQQKKKITGLLFLFVFVFSVFFTPLFASASSLSLIECNKIFFATNKKIVALQNSFPLPKEYLPEEEAAIVFAKKIIVKETINLNINKIPKEMLLNVILKSGKMIVKSGGDPLEMFNKEVLEMANKKFAEYFLGKEVKISGGEVSLSYEDVNREMKKEVFFYSLLRDERDSSASLYFYSEKKITPPFPFISYSLQSSLWNKEDFEGEHLNPFVVIVSGKLKERENGTFYWEENPSVSVDFPENFSNYDFPEKLTFLQKIGNFGKKTFAFFFPFEASLGETIKDAWQSLWGDGFFALGVDKNNKQTIVNLEEITKEKKEVDGEKKDNEKNSKEEENIKITPPQKGIVIIEKVEKIELNSAYGEELELLSGIGSVYAERIIENRPYCTLDDLLDVSGIGEATLKKIKDQGLAYVEPDKTCFIKEGIKEEREEKEEEKVIEDSNLENELSEEKKEEMREQLEVIRKRLEELKKRISEINNEEEEEEEEEEEREESFAEKIELNSALLKDLTKIIGVGEATAKKIIESRPYCALDDLLDVSGIGEATLKKIKDQGLAYVEPHDNCFREDHSSSGEGGSSGGGSSDKTEKVDSVEINSASKEHLMLLDGVGSVYAERIIENRPYCVLDDLLDVSGIGEATLKKIKDQGLAYVEPHDGCFIDDEKEEEEDDGDEEEGDNNEEEDDGDEEGEDEEEEEDDGDEEGEDEEEEEDEEPVGEMILISNAESVLHLGLFSKRFSSTSSERQIFYEAIIKRAENVVRKLLFLMETEASPSLQKEENNKEREEIIEDLENKKEENKDDEEKETEHLLFELEKPDFLLNQ